MQWSPLFIFIWLIALSSSAEAASAPTKLLGKSVTVGWTENRVWRFVGEASFHPGTFGHELRIYISSTGRLFSRQKNASGNQTSNQEEISGASGQRITPTFSNQSMTIFMGRAKGPSAGVLRITINFDTNFGSCNAQVVRAKQAGAGSIIELGNLSGKWIEIQSVTIPGASCSIQIGNVFSGE